MVATPNKNYPLQVTGTNVGTWGTVLNNGALSVIDNNLGGTLNISVAGSSNVNLTASQASYLIHNLTGVLTGSISYIFPALGGFFAITNNTSGNFTTTVQVVGGMGGGIIIPQGTTSTVYIDATTPSVRGFTGTQSLFSAASVGGSANAITIPTTVPANFSLANAVVFFIIDDTNTGPATLNVAGTGNIAIKKQSVTGLVDLDPGDFVSGLTTTVVYDGTYWISITTIYEGTPQRVSTNQALDFTALFNLYVATAPLNLTISRSSTTLAPYWWIEGNALGGAITIIPDANDSISVNGVTLSPGAHYIVPQGGTFKLSTDANGNLYLLFLASSSGTVTSVAASGGSTGLTFSGSPITGAGTLTLGGTLAATNGGTGLTGPGTAGNVLTSTGSGWASSATTVPGQATTTEIENQSAVTKYISPDRLPYSKGVVKAWGSVTKSGATYALAFGYGVTINSSSGALTFSTALGSANYVVFSMTFNSVSPKGPTWDINPGGAQTSSGFALTIADSNQAYFVVFGAN